MTKIIHLMRLAEDSDGLIKIVMMVMCERTCVLMRMMMMRRMLLRLLLSMMLLIVDDHEHDFSVNDADLQLLYEHQHI